jgi:hypothetical protein
MDPYHAPADLSAAEHARLDTCMVDIAAEARGVAVPDGSGNYRFGSSSSGLCVYQNGQFHDFAGGAHGHNSLQLIEHLYPRENSVSWAREWLARHPSNGSFVASRPSHSN